MAIDIVKIMIEDILRVHQCLLAILITGDDSLITRKCNVKSAHWQMFPFIRCCRYVSKKTENSDKMAMVPLLKASTWIGS